MSGSSLSARKHQGVPLLHRLTFTILQEQEAMLVELLSHYEISDAVKSRWQSMIPGLPTESFSVSKF